VSEPKPSQAVIEDGCIVIRVPISSLPERVSLMCDDISVDPFLVTNAETFAKDVVESLNGQIGTMGGPTPIDILLEEAFQEAAEYGSEGVDDTVKRCEACDEIVTRANAHFCSEDDTYLCKPCAKSISSEAN